MTIEEVSKLAYNMNRTLVETDGMGDEIEVVLPEWETTSDLYRGISITSTKAILNHTALAHPRDWFPTFVELMKEQGWTYGSRDEEKMTHPYLTDYDKLTIAQKQRLHLYTAVVNFYRDRLGDIHAICYKCKEPVPEVRINDSNFQKEFYHSRCLTPDEIMFISDGSRLSRMPKGWTVDQKVKGRKNDGSQNSQH